MKKFTLLVGALCAVLTAGAEDLTHEIANSLRLTSEELMQVEGSKRIAIRCTQKLEEGTTGIFNYQTYYNGTGTRVPLPMTEDMIFDWVSDGNGQYFIKKAFAEENAYLQNTKIYDFGAQDAANVAKFTAVKPENYADSNSFGFGEESEEQYYVRFCLNGGNSYFNFNGGVLGYNSGVGVWTVQNVIDMSSYYRLIINEVKDGVTTRITRFFKEGDVIEVPEYDGYGFVYEGDRMKTASDDQVVTVNYVQEEATLVTNETVSSAIVDGAVIALITRDTNAPENTYFNGAASAKTVALTYTNLFKVVGVEGSQNGEFYMQQLSSGMYVGISADNSTVTAVETTDKAAKFTAYIPAADKLAVWDTKPADCEAGVNTVRFETNGTFLNCQGTGAYPKYATGTGGWSYWYVYVYNDAMVSSIGKEYLAEKMTYVKDDTPGYCPLSDDFALLIEKIESSEITTVDEINAANDAFINGANLTGPFNGIYTITNKDGNSSRGYLCYAETQPDYVWSSGKAIAGVTLPGIDNDYSKWAFVEIDGSTFLFNVGAKVFIYPTGTTANDPWRFSASQAENIELAPSSLGIGIVEINSTINEVTYHMSISNSFIQPVGGHYDFTKVDGGVPFIFERVGDLSDELKSEMVAKDPTAIEEITVDTEKVQGIYDLQGRRLSAPVKGINIINGKKVLVK